MSIRVLTGPALSVKQARAGQWIGTLQGRRDDEVVIRLHPSGTEMAAPLRSGSRLEASLGKRGRAGRGVLIGMGASMVGGIAAGLIVCSGGNCESSGITGETGAVSTVLGIGGLLVGAGVGAITDPLTRSERWRAVPLQNLPYGDGPPRENEIRLGLGLPWKRYHSFAGAEGY